MLLQVDLYSRDRSGSFHVAPHGHHLCIWLAQRVKSVQSITFHRFTVRLRCACSHDCTVAHQQLPCCAFPPHGSGYTCQLLFLQSHQVFMSTALGLLSRAPLHRLEFDQCLIDAEVCGRA